MLPASSGRTPPSFPNRGVARRRDFRKAGSASPRGRSTSSIDWPRPQPPCPHGNPPEKQGGRASEGRFETSPENRKRGGTLRRPGERRRRGVWRFHEPPRSDSSCGSTRRICSAFLCDDGISGGLLFRDFSPLFMRCPLPYQYIWVLFQCRIPRTASRARAHGATRCIPSPGYAGSRGNGLPGGAYGPMATISRSKEPERMKRARSVSDRFNDIRSLLMEISPSGGRIPGWIQC